VVLDLVHASGDPGEHSEEQWRSGGQDDVVACPASAQDDRLHRGRQPAALRRGTEKKRVRGFETRRRLVQLHVFEGRRLVECSREMGLSYGRILAVWQGLVAEASGEGPDGEDLRQSVRAHSDRVLRHLVEKSLPLVAKSAAHGMIVVKSLESLWRLHGVAGPDENRETSNFSLEDVGAKVRNISPLLADKLARVRALAKQEGGVQ
jgi:hypothetical protein